MTDLPARSRPHTEGLSWVSRPRPRRTTHPLSVVRLGVVRVVTGGRPVDPSRVVRSRSAHLALRQAGPLSCFRSALSGGAGDVSVGSGAWGVRRARRVRPWRWVCGVHGMRRVQGMRRLRRVGGLVRVTRRTVGQLRGARGVAGCVGCVGGSVAVAQNHNPTTASIPPAAVDQGGKGWLWSARPRRRGWRRTLRKWCEDDSWLSFFQLMGIGSGSPGGLEAGASLLQRRQVRKRHSEASCLDDAPALTRTATEVADLVVPTYLRTGSEDSGCVVAEQGTARECRGRGCRCRVHGAPLGRCTAGRSGGLRLRVVRRAAARVR